MNLIHKLLNKLGIVLITRKEYDRVLESLENTQDDLRFLAHDINLRLIKLGETDE